MVKVPRVVTQFASVFSSHGYQCYLVGGAVRDLLTGRRVTDFDIATDARPEEVMRMFRRTIPTGIRHGTVTVLFHGLSFEVTTFRVDENYADGRHPERVAYVSSIQEDLARRDFTINAIAFDLERRVLLDPHDGRGDLRRRTIRAIGDPRRRFSEDALRLMRACRLAAQLDFTIETLTMEAIREQSDAIVAISAERIRDEITKILLSPKPSAGLELMRDGRLLAQTLPELQRGVGVEQRGEHCFDVYHHSILTCDAASAKSLELRLAALFHDIGKPAALKVDAAGTRTFHGHEEISARLADGIARRLRYPTRTSNLVRHLVRHHMFNYTPEWSDAAVRRFIARVGVENLELLLALRRADQIGTCGRRDISAGLIEFEKRLERALSEPHVLGLKDLRVNGQDVMKELGLRPGPLVGVILQQLLEAVIDDPQLNERTKLLDIARRLYEQRLR